MMERSEIPQPALRITLFGPIQVLIHGYTLPRMQSRKGMWLLALLTLRHNRPVEREWLTSVLWPDTGQTQAFANMRPILSELRNGLGDQSKRIQSPNRQTLMLDLDGSDVDVVAFDAAAKSGKLADMQKIAALYRGPLLEGCTEEWVFQERAVRERQCLDALLALGENAMANADYASATSFYERAATMDPLWDAAQRGWMEALAQNGDRNAAMRVYRDFIAQLKDDHNAAPDEQMTALYTRLRSEARKGASSKRMPESKPASSPFGKVSGYLPHPLTDLIGREDERIDIATCLRHSRLVTMVGPGGIGKTRLALAIAGEEEAKYHGGAWFVALDALAEGEQIASQIANVLGVKDETGRTTLQGVITRLGSERILLLLDNCEHLLQPSADMAAHLLNECAGLRILATSREPLGIPEETAWIVPGLAAAPPEHLPLGQTSMVKVLAGYESAQLFVERAQSVQKTFSLNGNNARTVAEICYRLGGLPLAIELAAARLRTLTITQISERLDDHLSLLTVGSRVAPSRHQTLRATLDWSYSLLTDAERTLLGRLPVFAGGLTLQAAEAVCSGEDIPADKVADLLASLCDKSLLVFQVPESGGRYRLLEMVRQYASEHSAPQMDAIRDRHLDWVVALTTESDEWNIDRAMWQRKIEQERDNIRTALDWSAMSQERSEAGLHIACSLWVYWYRRGEYREGRRIIMAALNRAGNHTSRALRADALNAAGNMATMECDYAAARSLCEEGLAIRRELGDIMGMASSLNALGNIADNMGNSAEACKLYDESLSLFRTVGHPFHIAMLLGNLSTSIFRQDLARARSLCQEALDIHREAGGSDAKGIVVALTNVAAVAYEQHDYPAAQPLLAESLERASEAKDKSGMAMALLMLGDIAIQLKDRSAAQPYYEESLSLCIETGEQHCEIQNIMGLGHVARDRKDFAGAQALYEQCLERFREIGAPTSIGWALYFLGAVAGELGDFIQARTLYHECAHIFQSVNDVKAVALAVIGMAYVEFNAGHIAKAARIWGAAEAVFDDDGTLMSPRDREKYDAIVCEARSVLGSDIFDTAFGEGRRLSWEEATASSQEE